MTASQRLAYAAFLSMNVWDSADTRERPIMSSINAEAYVIESDGTKTAIPVSFVEDGRAKSSAAGAKSASAFNWSKSRRPMGSGPSCSAGGGPSYTANAYGYAPQNPFTTVDSQTTAPKRSLHLGRRILGLGIAAIGVPLLILPGPGLALIGLGLLMVVMP